MKESFSKDNKLKAFDFIFEEYFKSGFTSMQKGEIDLLFFSSIMKYSSIENKSDYSLSKELKITQARIRNMKVKEALKYSPIKIEDVRSSFLEKAEFARIEDGGKKISIPIFDPNIYIELENLIERENGFVEVQLNSKIFTVRIDQFINLLILLNEEKETSKKEIQKEYLKKIKELLKQETKYASKVNVNSIVSIEDVQKLFLEKGVEFSLGLLAEVIPMGSFALNFIKALLPNSKRK